MSDGYLKKMVYQSESSRYYKVAWTSSKSVEVVEISLEESLEELWDNHPGWCPPVISWFINPINYSYICHKP